MARKTKTISQLFMCSIKYFMKDMFTRSYTRKQENDFNYDKFIYG